MKIEIAEGASDRVGDLVVTVVRVSRGREALVDGRVHSLVAELEVDGAPLAVSEGSLLKRAVPWQVVRVRRRGGRGLVRLRPTTDEPPERFQPALDVFQDGDPASVAMSIMCAAVADIQSVIARLDDHPDVIGGLGERLAAAAQQLRFARTRLEQAKIGAAVVVFIDRHLELCAAVQGVVAASTQERDIEA